MASEANTARAMILISRWCCSSVEAIGGPIKIRFIVEYIPALTLSCGGRASRYPESGCGPAIPS